MQPRTVESLSSTMPWRTGNRVTLLPDGDQFFPRMLQAIEQAQSSVDMEMYLFESGQTATRFISRLSAATERGVKVRLLLDHFGAFRLSQQDVLLIRDCGIELRYFNSIRHYKWLRNLSRDHRKILLLDRQIAFVGGTGITDDFSPKVSGPKAWRELMVEMEGPVVRDWQILFERVWANHDIIHSEALRQRILTFKQPAYNAHHMNREVPQARVNATRGLGSKPIMGALLAEIKKAQSHIWISTAYFYPPGKLLKALRKAALRGIDVRILVPGPYSDHPSVRYASHAWYSVLLQSKVRIYEYQPRFLHMKLALVDDWCSIGSSNFDSWNLRWNLEANVEIIDNELSDRVQAMLINDFSNSVEFALSEWKRRPRWQKLREYFWRYVGLILTRLSNE